MSRKQLLFIVKLVLACAAVTALVSIPARRLAPGLSLFELLLLLFFAMVVLVAATIVSLTVAQFVLRKGGTDTQWFWFGGEPPGLQDLREQQQSEQRREP